MSELGAAHKQRMQSTFAQIDAVLDALAAIVGTQGACPPQRAADLTPLQRQRIAETACRLRTAMADIAARHGLTLPSAGRSEARECSALLGRAVVLAQALGPRQGAGEDPPSDEADAELHRIVAALFEPLDRMRAALVPPDIAATADGELGELRRIVDAHGLLGLRPRLADLIEHAAAGDLRIAVYGRVNAGKSSLLNRLLGADVLPTGATPVTAVPVLLRHGARARGLAEFADAAPDVFTPGRLAEFAAEHFNAGNARHVTRLSMELNAARLEGGVTLIDTPGLSSDAPGLPELPASDIGIVLVDATGGLSVAEARLAAALHRGATEVLVLLGKADLLGDTDRWRVYGHVRERLAARSGVELPLYLASSMSADAALRDDWIVRGLEPRLARRREIVAASLGRKTEALREAVAGALRSRLASLPRADDDAAASAFARALALLEAAIARPAWAADEADRQSRRLVAEVAHNAAVIGSVGDAGVLDLGPMIAASLQARADAAAKDVVRELEALAAQCGQGLPQAGGQPLAAWREAGPAPALEVDEGLASMPVHPPWLRWAGRWSWHGSIRRTLQRRQVRELAAARLAPFLGRLSAWRDAALAQIAAEVRAASERQLGEARRIERDLDTLRRLQSAATAAVDGLTDPNAADSAAAAPRPGP